MAASAKQIQYVASLYEKVQKMAPTLDAEKGAVMLGALEPFKATLVKVISHDEISYQEATAIIPVLKNVTETLTATASWRKFADVWVIYGPASIMIEGATVTVTSRKGNQDIKVGEFVHVTDSMVYAQPIQEEKAQPTGNAVTEPGFYRNDVGDIVEAYMTRKGFLVARDVLANGTKEYIGKAGLYGLSEIPTDELEKFAAAWGLVAHKCVFCSRKLEDKRSQTVGYGPDCAVKYGLPWGD